MLNAETTSIQVRHSAEKVPEDDRLDMLPKYFGKKMLLVEAIIFGTMDNLCPDYSGGMWDFYEIPNGFYMAPADADDLRIKVEGNYFDDTMSADAAGIVICLMVYSHLSFKYRDDNFSDLFLALRDFAGCHAEASKIYQAID